MGRVQRFLVIPWLLVGLVLFVDGLRLLSLFTLRAIQIGAFAKAAAFGVLPLVGIVGIAAIWIRSDRAQLEPSRRMLHLATWLWLVGFPMALLGEVLAVLVIPGL